MRIYYYWALIAPVSRCQIYRISVFEKIMDLEHNFRSYVSQLNLEDKTDFINAVSSRVLYWYLMY